MEAKKVGIWIRVSTEDQAKGESPEHHEARAKMYAEMRSWNVAEVYHLEAVSGKSVMHHPEARRMLNDVRRGHISGLIFSKLARLARNTKELLDFSDIFQKENADLISLHEAIDTSTPAGRLFYTIIAAMAQWEREEISERVAASVPIRAKMGKSLGGVAPFGYSKDEKGQLYINEEEAPIRKLMFELFLEHKKNRRVATILNEKGYRTRLGAKFKHSSIDRLLRDPLAKGLRRMNYSKSMGPNKHWVEKPKEEWVFHPAPAIVSVELWDKVNAILDEADKNKKPRKRGTVHLFSGILKCSCGGAMYMRTNSPRYVCKDCKNKVMPKDLEFVYKTQLKNFIFSDEEIQQQLDKEFKEMYAKQDEVKRIKQKIESLNKKVQDVFDLFHAGELKKESFKKYHKPLEEQLYQLEEEATRKQYELDRLSVDNLSTDKAIQDMRNLFTLWDTFTHEEKHKIIQTITKSIILSNETEEILITMKYAPPQHPSFETVTKGAHTHMGSYWLPT